MSLITSAISILAITICLLVVDKVGRRPLLLIGSAIQMCALLTMGALGTPNTINYPLKVGIVSMLAVMTVGFGLGWAPLTYVITSELPAIKLRDHTLRLGFFVNVAIKYVSSSPPIMNAADSRVQLRRQLLHPIPTQRKVRQLTVESWFHFRQLCFPLFHLHVFLHPGVHWQDP